VELSNNQVLITGGASGIGFALAEAFLRAGNTVAICGRSRAHLSEASLKLPALLTLDCDIANSKDRYNLRDWIASELPGLNVLVNNAGIQRDISFAAGIDEFLAGENEIRVNLEAPIVLTGLLIPVLSKNANSAILNVSSGLGFIPAARMPVYSASKAGMHAFSMALRLQLAKEGIKVFEIVPPAVDTNLNPEGRAGRGNFKPDLSPKAFVAAVMQALEQDIPEIGFGMTAGLLQASRADLDKRFAEMNSRV
jgi:uncharacterized oxidoreductase